MLWLLLKVLFFHGVFALFCLVFRFLVRQYSVCVSPINGIVLLSLNDNNKHFIIIIVIFITHQNPGVCWGDPKGGDHCGLYCSHNAVRVIKWRRMGWAEHVACMGRGEVYTGFWWGNLREREHWGDSGVDGRIILRWIFRKWDVGVWTGSRWLRIGTVGGQL